LSGRYKGLTPEDLKKMFVAEYRRIEPTSEEDYDRRRQKGTPCWHYTAKALGVSRWNELRELCGLMPKKGAAVSAYLWWTGMRLKLKTSKVNEAVWSK